MNAELLESLPEMAQAASCSESKLHDPLAHRQELSLVMTTKVSRP